MTQEGSLFLPVDLRTQTRHKERRDCYAAAVAERLRPAGDCQFSLLPYDTLVRTAALWYDACSNAMLRGNYATLDNLVSSQARIAAEEGFTLDDLLQLLRLCRQVAVEGEGWDEEQFVDVDAVINVVLARLRHRVAWTIPERLNYLTGKSRTVHQGERQELEAATDTTEPPGERRTHGRNKLHLPIHVRGVLSNGPVGEITHTQNVGKRGVYFLSRNPYYKGARVQVTYPYWDTPGGINREYPAQVVRIDEREGVKGVALNFLVDLGSQTHSVLWSPPLPVEGGG